MVDNKFNIGDIIYLKTDEEQLPRMILGFIIDRSNEILYKVVKNTFESTHYDFEMSVEKNVLITTTN